MKKLIMFVMVLAIAAPASALIYPPHSPGFAGCANSGQVIWEFISDDCNPSSAVVNPAYYFDPDLPDPIFGTRYEEGGPVWTWSSGQYLVEDTGLGTEDSLNQSIPESGGKQYMRMYFEVTHTYIENADDSVIGMGLELWGLEDWTGCPAASGNDGEIGWYIGGYEFPAATAIFDLDGGALEEGDWVQSIWLADFSEDGSVYMEGFEGETFDLFEATHTTAIIGMSDFGAEGFYLEEVYINYIWFNNTDGSDIPTTDCNPIFGGGAQRLIVETTDLPIYEPQDIGGPPPMGPTSGKLHVKLAWRPGDPGYPNFNCEVLIDPDPNQDAVGNADFSITNPTPMDPNGHIKLTFTQDNYNVFQDVTVTATQDELREGNESYNVLLTVTIDIDDPNFGSDPCEPVTQTQGIIVMDNDIPYISVLPADPCKPLKGTLTENDPCVPVYANITLSHKPTHDVDVFIERASDFELLLESMSVMVPPLGVADEPNRLTFTEGNYSVNQQIRLEARDDDDRPDTDLEWIPGVILLNAFSEDPRYQNVEEGGELEEGEVDFDVQDNECGAWGFDPLDVNEDCAVNLVDFANYYEQWLSCTYKDGRKATTGVTEFVDCEPAWGLEEE